MSEEAENLKEQISELEGQLEEAEFERDRAYDDGYDDGYATHEQEVGLSDLIERVRKAHDADHAMVWRWCPEGVCKVVREFDEEMNG